MGHRRNRGWTVRPVTRHQCQSRWKIRLHRELSNHRVQKFTSKGILVTKWGYENTGGEGASRRPHQLAINSGGRAFLTTRANSEILVFDSDGKFLTKWGSKGTADGTMQKPEDLAINPMTGDVYVTDTKNSRIQKFSEVR